MKYLLIVLLLFKCIISISQKNLVPNPSFEVYTLCPGTGTGGIESINLCPPWTTSNSISECVYFNECSNKSCCSVPIWDNGQNYQYPHSGKGFGGMYFFGGPPDIRGYIQTKLSAKLVANHCYYVDFFANSTDSYITATNNISLLIGDTAIKFPVIHQIGTVAIANPQIEQFGNPIILDTMNWVKVAGIYTAHGGEQYITIGSFKDDIHTDTIHYQSLLSGLDGAGYNIDDVSVIDLFDTTIKADAGRDTTIKQGDSVWIGSRLCGLTTQWFEAGGNNIANDIPGMWVKPSASTYYVLQQNVCGQLSADTVYITVNPLPMVIKAYTLRQAQGDNSQQQGAVNSWVVAEEVSVLKYNIQRSVDGKNFVTVGYVAAKGNGSYSYTAPAPTGGIGYYRLEVVDKDGKKSYSEVRTVELKINNEELRINPNPAKDFVTISGNNIKEISIVDLFGRTVITKAMNSNTINVAFNNLSKGIYLVKALQRDGSIKTEKLVVE